MEINDLLKNPEQLKGLITLLQTLVDAQQGTTESAESPVEAPQKTKRTRKSKNSSGTKDRENKFLAMPERNLHKEDIEIDKKLQKLPPTPRTRKFKQIKATCRVCGRSENVNPGYMTTELDRYKCNRCAGAAG